MRDFGPLEFSYMLLRRMADYHPAMVEELVERTGGSRHAVTDANRRWQAMIRSRSFPSGNRRYRMILGPPVAVERRRFGSAISEATQWRLPLWPHLRWETVAVPRGPVLHEWLVRPAPSADAVPSPPPVVRTVVRTVDELVPWEFVVGDIADRFTVRRHSDGDAPSRWAVEFEAAPGQRHLARFVWGLLQVVEPL